MELSGVNDSICEESHHTIKYLSASFLVSCYCDWICKACTEQQWRRQNGKLRTFRTNQDSDMLRCNTKEYSHKQIRLRGCGSSGKRRDKASAQVLTICVETHKCTTNSLGLGYSISPRAARHYGYEFRSKHCASNGGANLNAADTQTERTGVNLHFIFVILFSTNKLTPEKT